MFSYNKFLIIIGTLLNRRNKTNVGISWRASQIAAMARKEQRLKDELTNDASSAEKLVQSFGKRDDVNYVYVTFGLSDGLMLVTSKDRTKLGTNKSWSSDEGLPSREELIDLHKSNRLSEDGKLLLIFMFCSNEEIRLMRMFPEFIACDTTFAAREWLQFI